MSESVLKAAVLEAAREMVLPDGSGKVVLSLDDTKALAEKHGCPQRDVERIALLEGVMPGRYMRNYSHMDCSEQLKLLDAHVLLVGLGGLGGHVLDLLVRMGVGTITGADGDCFAESNLNRQLLSREDSLDVPKPVCAARHVAAINSSTTFIGIHEYLSGDALLAACHGKTVVIDALGGLKYRAELERAAATAGVPLVSAVVAGLSGYVVAVFPGETGPAEMLGTGSAAEDVLGTPSPVVACAASMQCSEVMRIIIGRPRMHGVLFFDLADRSFQNVLFEDV
ncbi:ThiF family adenylyltransferase [Desulfovibrio mangrovi]|uniref:ThiF family adenylyltransferase n=1 Tax=Desulfovibrio mangrovi TaxID=2976983 RepID=UPI0022485C6C|nr:ThiF family adenylyltransferase [Desulfovibrio mangrovi]UZP67944.1 ThiF family adenylyltransferase [Desulfovibrio mangrovi]